MYVKLVMRHNPYFNRWFSAIPLSGVKRNLIDDVTILILIDGFLQYHWSFNEVLLMVGHNPYFNRWFSAIEQKGRSQSRHRCHNPYFNRWFSAINIDRIIVPIKPKSQSLF